MRLDSVTNLCLFPDYCCDFPITLDGIYCGEEEVNFSEELLDLLQTWNQIFLNHFSPEEGWEDPEFASQSEAMIPEVIEAVRREVLEGFTFSVYIFFAQQFNVESPARKLPIPNGFLVSRFGSEGATDTWPDFKNPG